MGLNSSPFEFLSYLNQVFTLHPNQKIFKIYRMAASEDGRLVKVNSCNLKIFCQSQGWIGFSRLKNTLVVGDKAL